jgi:hypothetical protein
VNRVLLLYQKTEDILCEECLGVFNQYWLAIYLIYFAIIGPAKIDGRGDSRRIWNILDNEMECNRAGDKLFAKAVKMYNS